MIGHAPGRSEWRLLCAAWIAILFFRVAIALLGFRRINALFPAHYRPAPDAFAIRVAAAVYSASRDVPGATCLIEASAARALFACRGYAATMRIGVRKGADGRLEAHAWLLSRDRIIMGSGADAFDGYRPIADFS